MDNKNVNPDNHDNENENKYKGMTEEEYYASEPGYISSELPSNFLSEEDTQPMDVNIIALPNYDPNYNLIVENFLQYASECKNKEELFNVLSQLFELGIHHGMVIEKKESLLAQIDALEFETKILNGEIEVQIFEDYNEDEL